MLLQSFLLRVVVWCREWSLNARCTCTYLTLDLRISNMTALRVVPLHARTPVVINQNENQADFSIMASST